VHDRIQTHFKGRVESIGDVAEAIGTLVQGRRGNYLVYFLSFQYLNDVLQEFRRHYGGVPVLAQGPGMTGSERDPFLSAFAVEHGDTLVGFAVLGGVFGEGIDLVGERLIGAVIVGVGLPQLCVERDLIRDYFQQQNSQGFEYAYTFPGMNRVLQAVGRVLRSEKDQGVVLILGLAKRAIAASFLRGGNMPASAKHTESNPRSIVFGIRKVEGSALCTSDSLVNKFCGSRSSLVMRRLLNIGFHAFQFRILQ
jgi:Rad3-related DNA helicase